MVLVWFTIMRGLFIIKINAKRDYKIKNNLGNWEIVVFVLEKIEVKTTSKHERIFQTLIIMKHYKVHQLSIF